jgi:plasmid stabilization system protein ParE
VIELRVSEAASLAIVEQADYYRLAQGDSLAERWESAVDSAVRSLLSMPERGVLCRFRDPALTGIRWVLVPGFPKHMIFYRYSSQDEALLIVQVLHGARNLEVILNEDV